MNIFRILGDLSHLASILILIYTIRSTHVIEGISFKTQTLYALVFITRYVDLLTFNYISFYNTIMKIFFIVSSAYIVVLLQSYQKSNSIAYKEMILADNFKIQYILAASFALSLVLNYKFSVIEILWSFSLWLESFAILPQLFMLSKSGKSKSLTIHYIFALGLYRALYIPNWAWRYYAEEKVQSIALLAGIIQTLIYSDFFYIYYKKVIRGNKSDLPHYV
ncbi:similar to Saccharomyces cerevisiae YBL040C ERD2 HDEL receptor, an integral membrane protein that binds to the HDEL motif in proteins destined for retention in the endoplasmic reticulum [Maudiozyma barnettii]|uniref:Similar to Saccharomyces cerevisiae YBL040C ERD2 HDEL receptor, an integral membrane protein that binds to the HDEL motif in proteins destined for retention in the endoplasmic reticulum n=1 Tax=Maudiozyma barnettii TaxID=61262 RepID=A0A8H2VGU5_9SACH|nr:Erd2p [Kazachstania barnettii]CAB4254983.1 similar to Saccharomyces cerevisiae YBL040C ERD2 HDEL receptor, an integral membrane protein that binds to the HDEL motif in proteins destined for retention in the endoplasmic reticulum [Kazachstania barnettii]CAD1783254.1 similar to Saccharomyces cerevisiae YBL040C ERD2 HDEL receptor, an integral membrane protein that binds to the HDEL motif in proteins destined for retention in the endoplasmic reticulum [Kazachstania barnettii]